SVSQDPPLVIVSHICSTRIPYKTVGKENVADRQEIEKELRLALQFILRKLSIYMKKKGKAEQAKKRANLYAKYIPMIAQFCTELAGKKKEPNYKKILESEEALLNAAIPESSNPENTSNEKEKPVIENK
ncbi:MAG: DNA topoisomerase VI subunit B, partial [Nitrosopumilaceae archaeon]|nr:DNA topoisomerase VI subunit B [Nitrosopumilaceae archaeon]